MSFLNWGRKDVEERSMQPEPEVHEDECACESASLSFASLFKD